MLENTHLGSRTNYPAAKNLEEALSTFFYAIGVSPTRKALVAAVVHEYENWNRPFNTQEVPLQTVRIFGDSTFGLSAVQALLMHEGTVYCVLHANFKYPCVYRFKERNNL